MQANTASRHMRQTNLPAKIPSLPGLVTVLDRKSESEQKGEMV